MNDEANMFSKNLDKEYSPSWNTKRFKDADKPEEYILENFLRTSEVETNRVRGKYNVKSDIRYGGENDNQLLDIFYKDLEHGKPIFVFIHGGYWQYLDKSTSGVFVAPLVERNYRVVNVDYNLCPTVSLKDLCAQMWNFYNWLFKYAKETEASSIMISGHSAGAHLATILFMDKAMQLLQSNSIQTSFVLISGVYDLRELWKVECANPKNILGLCATAAEELSPLCWDLTPEIIKYYTENNTIVHILCAAEESQTFIAQSSQLAEKLSKVGLEVRFKVFDNYDHFDIVEEVPQDGTAINRYLVENSL